MKRWQKGMALLLVVSLCMALCIPCTATQTRWYGDVDRDGMLTSSDVRCVLRYIVFEYAFDLEQRALADYLQDGDVTTSDARAILIGVAYGEKEKLYSPPDEETALCAAAYNGLPFVTVNGNMPLFTEEEKQQTEAFERYSPLDSLGRCGTAYANLCTELMPTEERDSISSVTPTGWHNRQYDHVPGGWVYNRSHIIGFQLAGEQANAQNLITGTRYLNVEGMLPFENMIADYIKETDHHVLYRATPLFLGDNLLAEGVLMEAWSVEDNGEGICFYVFCYNVQPGVVFKYATGENYAKNDVPPVEDEPQTVVYILNIRTKKFHRVACGNAATITEDNRQEFSGDREELIAQGYAPCGNCDP